jgi:protein-S-isoprenylcysteine O-methyltransferase Ste14
MLALARPLMLGSLLGLAPGILGAIIILLRTALEDHTLQKTVDGYKAYAQTVRHRLFEGIW